MSDERRELHAFEVGVAEDVGVIAAIVFYELEFWVSFNMKEGKNHHKGEWWTYQSAASLARDLPYLTERQIRYAIDKLIEHKYIKRGNFNKKGYDKTKWYTINSAKTDTFVSFSDKSDVKSDSFVAENDILSQKVTNLSDASYKNDRKSVTFVATSDKIVTTSDNFVRPIPVTNTVTNTVTNLPSKESKPKKFTPPTQQQVEDYCFEKGYSIDAAYFIDYYTSNGWRVGKNSMKDWRATVRNWARREKESHKAERSGNEFTDLLQEEGLI